MKPHRGYQPPDWYRLIAAAKYLGVAPWDLLEQPAIWTEWALMAGEADAEAQDVAADLAKREA